MVIGSTTAQAKGASLLIGALLLAMSVFDIRVDISKPISFLGIPLAVGNPDFITISLIFVCAYLCLVYGASTISLGGNPYLLRKRIKEDWSKAKDYWYIDVVNESGIAGWESAFRRSNFATRGFKIVGPDERDDNSSDRIKPWPPGSDLFKRADKKPTDRTKNPKDWRFEAHNVTYNKTSRVRDFLHYIPLAISAIAVVVAVIRLLISLLPAAI